MQTEAKEYNVVKNKSIAKCTLYEQEVDKEFYLLYAQNKTDEIQSANRIIDQEKGMVQFHFCIKGELEFVYNKGAYTKKLAKEKSLVLYNPKVNLPIDVILQPDTSIVSMLIPIDRLHTFFSKEAHFIAFLNEENRDKKYYKEHSISPNIITILTQIVKRKPNAVVENLYFRAKALELLSVYFNNPRDIDLDQCPFLADEKNVTKIKLAKEIMIERLMDPPTLPDLATEIQLPLNRLKKGFKQVYGDTVYGFLWEYKMEQARQLLIQGNLNVNEIGLQLGYSAASHFISAFKKKYGTTPKRFLMDHKKV